MAIDMGKLQNKQIIMWSIIQERDVSSGILKGSTIAFLNDLDFRASQLEHDRTEDVCIQMDELVQKDFSHHMTQAMTQAEYFRYKTNWWISLNNFGRSGPLKNRSDFKDALTKIKPSAPRIWRTTTQASTILEVSVLALIIEFFFQLVAMERFLVELIINQRKSTNELTSKATWQNGETRCLPSLEKISDVRFSRFFSYFVAVGSFTADVGLRQPTGCVKTTLHKTISAVWISTRNSCTGQKIS